MEKFTTGTVRPMKPPGLALSVAAAPALYPSKDPVLSSVAPVAAPSRTNGRVWPKRHRATLKLKLSLAFNRSHIHNKVLKEYAPEN